MDKKLSLVSYALATMAALSFISGLAILSTEGRMYNGEARCHNIHD